MGGNRLVQEYRDRDSTSFQAHLKFPTNAIRTHVVEVQNAVVVPAINPRLYRGISNVQYYAHSIQELSSLWVGAHNLKVWV